MLLSMNTHLATELSFFLPFLFLLASPSVGSPVSCVSFNCHPRHRLEIVVTPRLDYPIDYFFLLRVQVDPQRGVGICINGAESLDEASNEDSVVGD